MASIVICDSCDVFRLGLASRIRRVHDVKLLASAENLREARVGQADLLILDTNGAKSAMPSPATHDVPVLLLVGDGDLPVLPEVLRRTAPASVLHRNAPVRTALVAVDTTLEGGRYIDPALASWREDILDAAMTSWGLTTREKDVCRAAGSGATVSQIAVELRLSRHTVKHHLSSVYSKVQVSGREELLQRLSPLWWLR
ncbi:MAG: response regulator transcription factor [Coriobacteriales bacterium]|nr:response regulator transcription factor [Coriobacteriales bacterium]